MAKVTEPTQETIEPKKEEIPAPIPAEMDPAPETPSDKNYVVLEIGRGIDAYSTGHFQPIITQKGGVWAWWGHAADSPGVSEVAAYLFDKSKDWTKEDVMTWAEERGLKIQESESSDPVMKQDERPITHEDIGEMWFADLEEMILEILKERETFMEYSEIRDALEERDFAYDEIAIIDSIKHLVETEQVRRTERHDEPAWQYIGETGEVDLEKEDDDTKEWIRHKIGRLVRSGFTTYNTAELAEDMKDELGRELGPKKMFAVVEAVAQEMGLIFDKPSGYLTLVPDGERVDIEKPDEVEKGRKAAKDLAAASCGVECRQGICKRVPIKKKDPLKKIVFAEVYTPYQIDSQGDWMEPDEIEKMAYDFMLNSQEIGKNHIEIIDGKAAIVESFIVRKGDPDFNEGAWVVGTKILDDKLWNEIEKGEITGYSIGGSGVRIPQRLSKMRFGKATEKDLKESGVYAAIMRDGDA